MKYFLRKTFKKSLSKLTAAEQKHTKIAVFDFLMDSKNSSLDIHPVKKSKDGNFYSAKVNDDIRFIVHTNADRHVVCYVEHHDKAYAWGEGRKKIAAQPQEDTIELIEIREKVEEKKVPKTKIVYEKCTIPVVFPNIADEALLRRCVSDDLYGTAKNIDNVGDLLALAELIPSESALALLTLALGGEPKFDATAAATAAKDAAAELAAAELSATDSAPVSTETPAWHSSAWQFFVRLKSQVWKILMRKEVRR